MLSFRVYVESDPRLLSPIPIVASVFLPQARGKSLPLKLLADPPSLTPVASISYENSMGRGVMCFLPGSNLESLTPVFATLPKNTPTTPLVATHPRTQDLKSFVCHTSAKEGSARSWSTIPPRPKALFCRVFLSFIGMVCCALPLLAQASPTDSFTELAARAEEAWKSNRYEEAATLYRLAVQQRPSWAEGWGYLASSLYELKQYKEARDAYRQTTALTPDNAPSWAFLGLCEYELRQYPESFEHLAKSEQLGFGNDPALASTVHYHLSILWNTAGQFERGMNEIAQLADAHVDNPLVMEATGLSALRMALFPYEIPVAKRDLIVQAGKAAWTANAHHLEDARRLYEQVVAAYPQEPNMHYAFGVFLVQLDQEAGLQEFEKEIKISPSHVPARVQGAFLCMKMGQFEKGSALAEQAVKLDPKNPAAHNVLGRNLVEMDRTTRGIAELALASRLAPKDATFHLNLAQAYQRAGKAQMAKKEFATFRDLQEKKSRSQPGSAPPQ